jgi:hypothetical protein
MEDVAKSYVDRLERVVLDAKNGSERRKVPPNILLDCFSEVPSVESVVSCVQVHPGLLVVPDDVVLSCEPDHQTQFRANRGFDMSDRAFAKILLVVTPSLLVGSLMGSSIAESLTSLHYFLSVKYAFHNSSFQSVMY